jgi:integrase
LSRPPLNRESFQRFSGSPSLPKANADQCLAQAWHRENIALATIRKRGKNWHVQIRRKHCPHITRTFSRKSDAQSWAIKIEAEADRSGIPNNIRLLEKISVADVLIRYRDEVLPSHRAGRNQSIIINAFLRDRVSKAPLSTILPEHFAAYRDHRLRRVQPATVTRELGIVQHAFEIAIREWGFPLVANPLKAVRKPKSTSARDRRLEADEWSRLLSACKRTRNPWLKDIAQIAVETAMRRSEILNIRLENVDRINQTLKIPVTKNGGPRTIPLTTQAMLILRKYEANTDLDVPVFPTSAEAIKLAWKRLTVRADVANLHFHDLRHEAISRFFEMGLSLPEVALISGHRDPRMLFRYTHLRAKDVASKLATLEQKTDFKHKQKLGSPPPAP